MKRFDPAEYFGEQHLRVAEMAKMLAIGDSTVRRLIKNHPRVRWLPKAGSGGKSGRRRRTPLIPLSVAKEIYAEMMR